MKNYIILIILFFSVSSFSQSNNEIIFKKGIDNYNIGNYNESIENFLEIIKNGEHSKELYFNLGNCYYKTNDIANSIYFYEKALKLDSNDIDIYNNLAFTQNMLIDKIDELPVNQLSNFFNIISNFFSINHWILIGIISLYLSLALFLLYFFKNDTKSKKKYFTFSSIFFCMTIISILTGLTKHENQKSNIEAIIFDKKIDFRTEPNYRSEVQFNLHEGTKVLIKEELDEWVLVELTNGSSGWLKLNSIKKIE